MAKGALPRNLHLLFRKIPNIPPLINLPPSERTWIKETNSAKVTLLCRVAYSLSHCFTNKLTSTLIAILACIRILFSLKVRTHSGSQTMGSWTARTPASSPLVRTLHSSPFAYPRNRLPLFSPLRSAWTCCFIFPIWRKIILIPFFLPITTPFPSFSLQQNFWAVGIIHYPQFILSSQSLLSFALIMLWTQWKLWGNWLLNRQITVHCLDLLAGFDTDDHSSLGHFHYHTSGSLYFLFSFCLS